MIAWFSGWRMVLWSIGIRRRGPKRGLSLVSMQNRYPSERSEISDGVASDRAAHVEYAYRRHGTLPLLAAFKIRIGEGLADFSPG